MARTVPPQENRPSREGRAAVRGTSPLPRSAARLGLTIATLWGAIFSANAQVLVNGTINSTNTGNNSDSAIFSFFSITSETFTGDFSSPQDLIITLQADQAGTFNFTPVAGSNGNIFALTLYTTNYAFTGPPLAGSISNVGLTFLGLDGTAPTLNGSGQVGSSGFSLSVNGGSNTAFDFTGLQITAHIDTDWLDTSFAFGGANSALRPSAPFYFGGAPLDSHIMSFSAVPEPASVATWLGATGLGLVMFLRVRNRRRTGPVPTAA